MRMSILAMAVAGVLIPASVYAAAVTVDADETYTEDFVGTSAEDDFTNNGTVLNHSIVINGGSFVNGESASITSGTVDVLGATGNGKTISINGIINASDKFIYRGAHVGSDTSSFYTGSVAFNADLNTELLEIVGSPAVSMLTFNQSSSLEDVGAIYIHNEEGNGKTRIQINSDAADKPFIYNSTIYLRGNSLSDDAGIEINSDVNKYTGDVYIAKIVSNSSEEGKSLLQINTASTAAVDEIVVESGTLNLQTYANDEASTVESTFALNKITLGENAQLNGVVGAYALNKAVYSGQITLNMASGAIADFGGTATTGHDGRRPDRMTFSADSLTINIANSDGRNHVYLPNVEGDTNTQLKTSPDKIHVVAASANNTGNAEEDLGKLVYIVQTNYKKDGEDHLECLPGVQLVQEADDIHDAAYGEVGEAIIDPTTGDCLNCGLTNVRTEANPNINGIAEMAALGLHIWRNEIDDMHRRLGELRDSSADANGLWTRVYNGKASFGGQDITNKYTAFQFGYDHQVRPGFWLGGALSYTYGDNEFDHGDGDSNMLAFTGYGSWLWDNGIYLDVTGKIGRMKNSFDIAVSDVRSSGDYHTNAVSVSAELGWRFYPIDNVFIQPELEMWYGHVFDVQYETSTGVNVDQDSAESLVGRAGVKLGIKCPNNRGSAFIKASVLHDWQGDADFRFEKNGTSSRTLTEELGGTWYEYGIGADLNATDQLHFWAELERGDGGEVDTDYRATIGMRYSW